MLKRRMISSALLCLAVACQGRGLQPVAQSATTPTTNPTPATTTSVSEVAPAQPSTTATTEPDIPETVPVTRPRPTPATVRTVPPAIIEPDPSWAVGADVWWSLALCESGGANVDTGNGYSGYFQFLDSTWRSVGYSGRAVDHGYETQRAGAQTLQARSGWGQWPACSRRLGLR